MSFTIAVAGKGGVGKSFVTSMIAVTLNRRGYKVGILDGDITGPSIPKAFGIDGSAYGDGKLIFPLTSTGGIKVMSSNLLLENKDDPIIWRGSLLGNLVKQFYEEVLWEELDYLVIDMPPGTGDIALTVFQTIPVDDLVIVTSPQDLVSLIVTKAIKMANMMDIPIYGLIENMSYVECPDCGKKISIFGESHLEDFSKEIGFKILGRLPLVSSNAKLVDSGEIEKVSMKEFESIVDNILGDK